MLNSGQVDGRSILERSQILHLFSDKRLLLNNQEVDFFSLYNIIYLKKCILLQTKTKTAKKARSELRDMQKEAEALTEH